MLPLPVIIVAGIIGVGVLLFLFFGGVNLIRFVGGGLAVISAVPLIKDGKKVSKFAYAVLVVGLVLLLFPGVVDAMQSYTIIGNP